MTDAVDAAARDAGRRRGDRRRSASAAGATRTRDFIDPRVLAERTVASQTPRWRGWLAPARTGRPGSREVGGRIAGYAAVGPSADADATARAGSCAALYVDPPAQGAGLGARLHDARARAAARRWASPSATLWVFAQNELGAAFYERRGWVLDPAGAGQEGADWHGAGRALPRGRLVDADARRRHRSRGRALPPAHRRATASRRAPEIAARVRRAWAAGRHDRRAAAGRDGAARGSVYVADLDDRPLVFICRRDATGELVVVTLWEREGGPGAAARAAALHRRAAAPTEPSAVPSASPISLRRARGTRTAMIVGVSRTIHSRSRLGCRRHARHQDVDRQRTLAERPEQDEDADRDGLAAVLTPVCATRRRGDVSSRFFGLTAPAGRQARRAPR